VQPLQLHTNFCGFIYEYLFALSMKKNIFTLFALLYICLLQFCFAQFKPMGFDQPFVHPPSTFMPGVYYPRLVLEDDTLFVCSGTGIYRKTLNDDSEWKLYAFENIPIADFIKNGNTVLAVAYGTKDGKDSVLLLSNDGGKTFVNYSHPHFFELLEGKTRLTRISQNSENKNTIYVGTVFGISKSDDFGLTWKRLVPEGYTEWWQISNHPFDSQLLFAVGESGFITSIIGYSTNNGNTWEWQFEYFFADECIYSLAFHPTNPDIILCSLRAGVGSSTDRGKTWSFKNIEYPTFAFSKILFDKKNPAVAYTTGGRGIDLHLKRVFRSTDMGVNWVLIHEEDIGCGNFFLDMVLYENKLIFYTVECGLLELELEPVLNDCAAVNNLTSEKCSADCILLNWSEPESNFQIKGYSVFRNKQLLNNELITETIFIDDNLSDGNYEYYVVTHYTNHCISYPSNNITAILEVDEIEVIEKIVIYPNPATGELRINSGELRIENVEFFDIYGRKLQMSPMSLSSPETVLNISHLPAGVYFLRVNTNIGQVIKKVLKE